MNRLYGSLIFLFLKTLQSEIRLYLLCYVIYFNLLIRIFATHCKIQIFCLKNSEKIITVAFKAFFLKM